MKFSNWQLFDKTESGDISQQKGIYAFAISNKQLSGFDVADKAIVYFGMTNSKGGLRCRLGQFRRTLFEGKESHGGALRLRFAYNDNPAELKGCLYFAVCEYMAPSNQSVSDELRLMGEVAKAEYVALAAYVSKHRRLPNYNDKKLSPKK